VLKKLMLCSAVFGLVLISRADAAAYDTTKAATSDVNCTSDASCVLLGSVTINDVAVGSVTGTARYVWQSDRSSCTTDYIRPTGTSTGQFCRKAIPVSGIAGYSAPSTKINGSTATRAGLAALTSTDAGNILYSGVQTYDTAGVINWRYDSTAADTCDPIHIKNICPSDSPSTGRWKPDAALVRYADSLAELKALTSSQMASIKQVFVREYSVGGGFGSGTWIWRTSAQVTALGISGPDGGAVIAPSGASTCASGCMVEKNYGSIIDAGWYGAQPGPSIWSGAATWETPDSTTAWQNAVNALKPGMRLVATGGAYVTGKITVTNLTDAVIDLENATFDSNGKTGDDRGWLLVKPQRVIGRFGRIVNSANIVSMPSTLTSYPGTGLEARSADHSTFFVNKVDGIGKGIALTAVGAGNWQNNVTFGTIEHTGYGVYLGTDGNDAERNFITGNVFHCGDVESLISFKIDNPNNGDVSGNMLDGMRAQYFTTLYDFVGSRFTMVSNTRIELGSYTAGSGYFVKIDATSYQTQFHGFNLMSLAEIDDKGSESLYSGTIINNLTDATYLGSRMDSGATAGTLYLHAPTSSPALKSMTTKGGQTVIADVAVAPSLLASSGTVDIPPGIKVMGPVDTTSGAVTLRVSNNDNRAGYVFDVLVSGYLNTITLSNSTGSFTLGSINSTGVWRVIITGANSFWVYKVS
jgi:hypothetical protein